MNSIAAIVTAVGLVAIVSGTMAVRSIESTGEASAPVVELGTRSEFDTLREEARGVLRKHCGSCHDPANSTAKPDALKVFNLAEEAWQVRMSKDQLEKAAGRVDGTDATKAQRERFRAFIAAEVGRRAAATAGAEPQPSVEGE